eukprot:CAMPEP_0179182764 /NCGR_PEP_ID=MMETSP0796-20121207/90564_1 /TAXON_ID=73915 /ORGANISM="Pyrodinium bahamense, Strain pbaha01" /LENGTH=108 /DNA_ID=CAMNT_0020886617 /DNA_START=69 /DNA_END=395 /DNA_ORIENTATION=+
MAKSSSMPDTSEGSLGNGSRPQAWRLKRRASSSGMCSARLIADVQVEVAVVRDVRQQHMPGELQLQGEFTQRQRGGEDHSLGADTLLGRALAAERDLLQRQPLVVHVA